MQHSIMIEFRVIKLLVKLQFCAQQYMAGTIWDEQQLLIEDLTHCSQAMDKSDTNLSIMCRLQGRI